MRHAQQRPHTLLFHASFIKHIHTEAKLIRHITRAFRHIRRRHVCAGLICKIACEVHGFSDDSAAFNPSLNAGFISAIEHNYELLNLPFFLIRRTVFVRVKQRHDRTLNDHGSDFFRISLEPGNNRNRLGIFSS
jgi:hypothetical protein